jgi:hypothetical protein
MPKSLDESLPFFAGSRDTLATSAVAEQMQEEDVWLQDTPRLVL